MPPFPWETSPLLVLKSMLDVMALAGFLLFALSTLPVLRWRRHLPEGHRSNELDEESLDLIVPARNEEQNIGRFLAAQLRKPSHNIRILVVDDQSVDRTSEIAHQFESVQVIQAHEKPKDWHGKNWACHLGSQTTHSPWIAFADADTEFTQDSLHLIVGRMQTENLDMISCIPFHTCASFWEKFYGPFYSLVLATTGVFSQMPWDRPFAVGQLLVFRRSFYQKIGGHQSVKLRAGEDLALVDLCFAEGGRYKVIPKTEMFKVEMYASFLEFIAGWRRNFRIGIRYSSLLTSLKTFLMIYAHLYVFLGGIAYLRWSLAALITLIYLAVQHKHGHFRRLGAIFWPVSVITFFVVTFLAITDTLSGQKVKWKQREFNL